PFKRLGWYPEMTTGMSSMGPETAEPMMQTSMYEAYRQVAPRVEDWPILVRQVAEVVKIDYDWSDQIGGLSMPFMLVIGDADGVGTPGMIREEAGATDGMWAGLVRTASGVVAGWHHHGAYESTIFVVSGSLRMEFGPGGTNLLDAGPGDFLYLAPGAVHRES